MVFRRRLLLLYGVALGGAALVWLRVAQLQLLQRERWERAARRAREQRVELEGRRGAIVDAEGSILVEDVPVLQLALVPREWKTRQRWRCEACGAVQFLPRNALSPSSGNGGRPRRCRCKASADHLVPWGEGDVGPLEDLLALPRGGLATFAANRQEEIERLVLGEQQRILAEDGRDFLTEDRLELFRLQREELPVPIRTDVPEEAARLVALDEEGATRGLLLRPAHRRVAAGLDDPLSGALARVIGQSRAAEHVEELERLRALHPEGDLDLRTPVGRSGLEAAYETQLRGRAGFERRERDDLGGFSVVVATQAPESGRRVRLAIRLEDVALAQRALSSLPDVDANYAPRTRPSGALVAANARTGEIVALAELPALTRDDLDPRFPTVWPVPDVERGEWVPAARVPGPVQDLLDLPLAARERLVRQSGGLERLLLPWRLSPPVLEPLDDVPPGLDPAQWRTTLSLPVGARLSRVSQVAVEPGSTFKPFIGLALLESGLGLPMADGFHCSGKAGKPGCHPHGDVDFEGALCTSCNQYFAYSLRNFQSHWPLLRTSVAAFVDRLGFGHRTEGDLAGESRGRWLRSAEWGVDEVGTQADGQPGRIAIPRDEAQNVAIGQGAILVTPLQMLRGVAVLANGGHLVTPHLGRQIEGAAGEVSALQFPRVDLGLSPISLARVREGLRRVVYEPGGTAQRSFEWGRIPGRVFGKTGTAQVGPSFKPFHPHAVAEITHHWFIGWLERDGHDPLAFVVVYHARTESAAGATAAKTAAAFLSAWCAREETR